MGASLTNMEFRLFKKYIEDKCGIEISEEKAYLIETRLSRLLVDSGMTSFDELYQTIMRNNDPRIVEKVIDAITTNETLWFRDRTPWQILEQKLLPHYIEQIRSYKRNKVRLWSAASSTGQEAYSTAMCIDNYLEKNGITDISLSNFEILATDISQTVLEIAKKGRYDAISIMRGMDPAYKEKYFHKEGTAWEINDKIKAAVRFQSFNLQNSYMFLGRFDVIFIRYVMIYFSDTLKEDISEKLYQCIEDDGALFLGSSELYSIIEARFKMEHYGDGTFYRRRVDRK